MCEAGLHPASPVPFQSVLNVQTAADEDTEEEKVQKHKTFVEKHAKEIQHFGKLLHWPDGIVPQFPVKTWLSCAGVCVCTRYAAPLGQQPEVSVRQPASGV